MTSNRDARVVGRLPVYVSLAAHGLVAVLFVSVGMQIRPKLVPAAEEYQIAMLETAGGSAMTRVPLLMAPNGKKNGEAEAAEARTSVHVPPQKRKMAKASGSASQLARAQDRGTNSVAGNGSDARDATFAFSVYSPRPPVTDRGMLPSSDQQVVLDVRLNAAGEVTGETLVRGIGNALDRMALEAVRVWRFQPATVNGKAVGSEAEVIFTFGPHYPVSNL